MKNGSPKVTTIEKWFVKSHNHWEIVLQMSQPLRNSSHIRCRRKAEVVKETTITNHCEKFKPPKQFMWNIESRQLTYNQVQENVQDSNVKKKKKKQHRPPNRPIVAFGPQKPTAPNLFLKHWMNGKLLDGKCKLIKRYWQIAISMEAVQGKKKAAMHTKKKKGGAGGRGHPFLIAKKKNILFCESIVSYCTKNFPLLKWAHGES